MVMEVVAHDQINLTHRQRWHAAHIIGPLNRAIANDEFRLRKEPVRGRAVTAASAGKIQTGNRDLSVLRAPDVQMGQVNVELLKLEGQGRLWRQCGQHTRQAKGLASHGVEQFHVAQLERGNHATRLRADGTDRDRHAEHPRGLRFKLRAKIANSRHNQPMQRTPSRCKQKPG